MAVEIPVTRRTEIQAPMAEEAINLKAPNAARDTSAQMQGFGNLVEGGIDSYNNYQKVKLSTYDLKTTDKANQFESAMKSRLAEIKNKEGDTSQEYIKFDQDMDELAQSMSTSEDAYDDEYREILQRKLFNTASKLRGSRDVQQSAQQYAYRKKVVGDSVALNQENMLEYGSFVDIKKPETFTQMDVFRDQIIQTRLADADQRGVLVRDENGAVDWNQGSVGADIRTDMGKAIKPLVNGLNELGKVEEAKEVLARYSDYINSADRLSLLKETTESNVKRQALVLLEDKGYNITLDQIDALKEVSAEVKSQMRTQLSIRNSQVDRATKSMGMKSFENAARMLDADQGQATPKFASWKAFEDSKEYKAIAGSINNTQRKALRNIIEKPTTSDPKAMNQILDLMANEDILTMDAADRNALIYQLKPSDQSRIQAQIHKMVSGKSPQGVTQSVNNAYRQLDAAILSLKNEDGKPMFNTMGQTQLGKVLKGEALRQYVTIKADIETKMNSVSGQWDKKDFNEFLAESVNNVKASKDKGGWFGDKTPIKPVNRSPVRKSLSTLNSAKAQGNRSNNAANNSIVNTTQSEEGQRKLDVKNSEDYATLRRLYKEKTGKTATSQRDILQFKNQQGL